MVRPGVVAANKRFGHSSSYVQAGQKINERYENENRQRLKERLANQKGVIEDVLKRYDSSGDGKLQRDELFGFMIAYSKERPAEIQNTPSFLQRMRKLSAEILRSVGSTGSIGDPGATSKESPLKGSKLSKESPPGDVILPGGSAGSAGGGSTGARVVEDSEDPTKSMQSVPGSNDTAAGSAPLARDREKKSFQKQSSLGSAGAWEDAEEAGAENVPDVFRQKVRNAEVDFLMLVCNKNADDGLEGNEILFAVCVWEAYTYLRKRVREILIDHYPDGTVTDLLFFGPRNGNVDGDLLLPLMEALNEGWEVTDREVMQVRGRMKRFQSGVEWGGAGDLRMSAEESFLLNEQKRLQLMAALSLWYSNAEEVREKAKMKKFCWRCREGKSAFRKDNSFQKKWTIEKSFSSTA